MGTPACTYTNICQICCITSTLFRASLLENRLLWPCFEIERIISCPLFYFSDRLSPPLLKSALNLADSCSHFGNLKQPMVNQLGLAPSSFVCWSIKPFHWSINQSNQDSDSPVAKRVPWSLKFRHYCKSHLPLGLIRNAEFHKGFYFRCKMSDSDVKSTRPFKQRKSFGKPICLVFCLHAALLMFCCSPCDANLNRPAIFFNFSQSERWSCWNPSQVPVKNSCE